MRFNLHSVMIFKAQKKEKLIQLLLSFSLSLCIILFTLRLLLIFNPIYYRDLKNLPIVKKSPNIVYLYQKEYNTITDYLKNPQIKDLKFKSFPMSSGGKYHFKEVKNLFNIIFVLFFITFNLSLYLINWCRDKNLIKYLKTTALILISIVAIFLVLFSINFDATFNMMHKLLFNNDYWLFDPTKDPIINILPEEFFLHCGIFILVFMCTASLLLTFIYKAKKHKT